ncbi:hypothetical protein UlMin_045383 [Ulmus minor]
MSMFMENIYIRNVWADNLEEEMMKIRGIAQSFPYVGLDTEFPGVVVKDANGGRTKAENNYIILKENVNKLKLIQLGLTFFDEYGNLPTCGTDHSCVWQFNFREFDPRIDRHYPDSIALLAQNGMDFKKNNEKGIDAATFRGQFTTSGILSDKNRRWVTFHGAYDFGYLIKMLTGENIPETLQEFSGKLREFLPAVYDIKHVMKYGPGMNKLADDLEVRRFGINHQAGSGSLVTARIFMKLKERHSEKHFEDHVGVLFGLADD